MAFVFLKNQYLQETLSKTNKKTEYPIINKAITKDVSLNFSIIYNSS
jgi:hypothetical protein